MSFTLPRLTALVIALALPLSACGQGESPATKAVSGTPVATVNGSPVTDKDLEEYMQFMQNARQGQPVDRETALNELIDREVLRQAAEKAGIQDRDEVVRFVERQRTNVMVNTLVQEKVQGTTFTDEQVKAEFERQVAEAGGQYKARHILVETEDAAKAAIEALNGGADFAELAKEKSTGPSAPKGGDLGWFVADSMVPPFAQALKALEVGKYTATPVQTQFGWHVILLEETRPLEPPPFEAVKDQVRQQMLQKSLQDYLEGLKGEAKIELK